MIATLLLNYLSISVEFYRLTHFLFSRLDLQNSLFSPYSLSYPQIVRHNFDLRPGKIVQELDLKKPIYQQTSCYGHFGRDMFAWERPKTLDLSMVEIPAQPPRRRKRTDSACI